MTNEPMIVLALISLTVVIIGHIFIIARWSGKVDAQLEEILKQPTNWVADLNAMGSSLRNDLSSQTGGLRAELAMWAAEVQRLRDARHNADGKIQIHEGKFQSYDRILDRLDIFVSPNERVK
jgi:hypothetical protein